MPYELRDAIYLNANEETFENTLIKIIANLNVLQDEKENRQRVTEEEREVLQVSLSQFIEKTMNRLQENERKNRRLSYMWYIFDSGNFIFIV